MKKEKDNELKRKSRNSVLLFMGVIVIAQIAMMFFGGRFTENGATAVVTVDGDREYKYSLYVEREVAIDDTNTLIIKEGRIDMISADCPDQVCVNHAPISKEGETIICLPNKVVVTIEPLTEKEKPGRGDLDAVVK